MDEPRTAGPHGCRATAKTTGRPCKNNPGPGAVVCWIHGGKAPQAQRKAARRQAEAETAAVLERWQPPGNGDGSRADPLEELARLAARLSSLSDYLTGYLERIEPGEWAAPDELTTAKVMLWQRTSDQAGRLLTDIARLDIDRRMIDVQVAATKITVSLFAGLIDRILGRAGLDCRPGRVREIIREELGETDAEVVQLPPRLARYGDDGDGAA